MRVGTTHTFIKLFFLVDVDDHSNHMEMADGRFGNIKGERFTDCFVYIILVSC